MIRTFQLEQPNEIAAELVRSGIVLVDIGARYRTALDLLTRCDLLLRSNAAPVTLEAKTMFPTKLAKVPHSERNVFQFFESGREPPPGISEEILDLVAEVKRCPVELFRALLKAFCDMGHITPKDLEQLLDPAEWVLNAVHYPGLPGLNGQIRFPAHRDWGLLAGYPAIDGLGFQAQINGEWVTLEPTPGSMLMYAGQALTMASWGNIPALPHRVLQLSEAGRSALIEYADAPRGFVLPDGRTVDQYINSMLDKIGQTASAQA